MKNRKPIAPIVSQKNITKRSKRMVRFISTKWGITDNIAVKEQEYNSEVDSLTSANNRGLIITIFVLCLIIFSLVGYIFTTMHNHVGCGGISHSPKYNMPKSVDSISLLQPKIICGEKISGDEGVEIASSCYYNEKKLESEGEKERIENSKDSVLKGVKVIFSTPDIYVTDEVNQYKLGQQILKVGLENKDELSSKVKHHFYNVIKNSNNKVDQTVSKMKITIDSDGTVKKIKPSCGETFSALDMRVATIIQDWKFGNIESKKTVCELKFGFRLEYN